MWLWTKSDWTESQCTNQLSLTLVQHVLKKLYMWEPFLNPGYISKKLYRYVVHIYYSKWFILPQCPTCGPIHLQQGPDSFRCFGPNLCCSPAKGCLSGSLPGVRACAYEDMNASPCENHVKYCKSVGEAGQCVYKGICCNPKGNFFKVIIK